jgi:prophage regulatory protein
MFPALGCQEIRDRLGVSETQFEQISRHDNFPVPVADLHSGRVWLTEDIEQWSSTNHPSWRQLHINDQPGQA